MVSHRSLDELEDAHARESATARMRIERAEEYVAYYRSRIDYVRESCYSVGAREGIADDPGFREEFQRVADIAHENVRQAGRMIAELEDDYQEMTVRHADEREGFLAEERRNE